MRPRISSHMNERTVCPDAFGDLRRDFLQIDDPDRQARCGHRDTEDAEQLRRTFHPLDHNVQIGYLTGFLPVEPRPHW